MSAGGRATVGLKRGYVMKSRLIFGLLLAAIVSGCGGGSGSISSSPPAAPSLSSVAVTPKSATFTPGASQQFDATAAYSDGSTKDVASTATWSSSNSSVATVSASGLAMGIAVGSATITATLSGVSGSANVTVNGKTLASIQLSPSSATLAIGISQQFTVAGTYSDGSIGDVSSTVTWSSSNPNVAKVSSSGVATTVGQGSVSIIASSGTVQGSTTLTVPQSSGGLVLNTNPADSLLVRGTSSDGTSVHFYGSRDATGVPSSVSAVSATQPDGSVQTALLDAQGRLIQVSDSAGVDFEIDWTSSTTAVATAYPSDGATPVSVPIEMPSTQAGNSSAAQLKAKTARVVTSQSSTPSSTQITANVHDSCLPPNPIDDATVQVVFTDDSGTSSVPYPLVSTGNGSYTAEFASSQVYSGDYASMASTAQGLVNGFCQDTAQVSNLVCSGINLALAFGTDGLSTKDVTLIQAACLLVNPATKVCSALSSAVNSWDDDYDPTLTHYSVTASLPPAQPAEPYSNNLTNPEANLTIPDCLNPTSLHIVPGIANIGVGQVQPIRVDMFGGLGDNIVLRSSAYPIQWSTSDAAGTYVLAANQNLTTGMIESTGPNISVTGVALTPAGSGVEIYASVPTLPALGQETSTITVQGCSADGTWTGFYSGTDGSSGTVSANFIQDATFIAGEVMATDDASGTTNSSSVTGTDINGALTFGPVTVGGTSDTADGSFSASCLTASGSFTISGTDTVVGSYTVGKQQ